MAGRDEEALDPAAAALRALASRLDGGDPLREEPASVFRPLPPPGEAEEEAPR